MNFDSLFELANQHRQTHKCGALPYEHGHKLVEAIKIFQPSSILEIGTGMGYTSALMALSNSLCNIDTIEKDPEHAQIARDFLVQQGVADRVNVIEKLAESYLPNTNHSYDLIFFDGYQIHYEFLPHYEKLLRNKGILFLANNHLQSKTSNHFFKEINQSKNWRVLEQFADTTIYEKL